MSMIQLSRVRSMLSIIDRESDGDCWNQLTEPSGFVEYT